MSSEFRAWFAQKFGAPFPLAIRIPLSPAKIDDVFASIELESPPMTPEFRDTPGDYSIAGFWGRGINSYAFYFVEVFGAHRTFLRIPYGGVYAGPAPEASVLDALKRFQDWRAKFESKLRSSTIIDNMGMGLADLELANGGTVSTTFEDLNLAPL